MKELAIVILIVCVVSASVIGVKLFNAQNEIIQALAEELVVTQTALLICEGGVIVPDDGIKIQEASVQSTNGRTLASTMMW